ncbi:hypothetical protein [Almyronema epifaneia]|uniref:Uncharacterized protein n=1 Tax=Almyronema epifaneia S1 TaxID=2991925 RepID=A0ABW6IB49_9CYAN
MPAPIFLGNAIAMRAEEKLFCQRFSAIEVFQGGWLLLYQACGGGLF